MIIKIQKELDNNNEVYLRVKANPGASKSEIKQILDNETIKMNVAAIPEKGKANKEIIKFFAKLFKLKKENIKIISGASSKIKLIKIVK